MISCVFCCKQDSDIYFSFNDKSLLNLWCTELLNRSFLLEEPYSGFPTCKECMTLHDRVVALNDRVKKYKRRIYQVFNSFKEKVVVSDSNARLIPGNASLNFNVPWNDKLGENCKSLRNALLGYDLVDIVIGEPELNQHVPVSVPPVLPVPPTPLNSNLTPSLTVTNALQPQATSHNHPNPAIPLVATPTSINVNVTPTPDTSNGRLPQAQTTLNDHPMPVPAVLRVPSTLKNLNVTPISSLNVINVLPSRTTLHNHHMPVSSIVPPTPQNLNVTPSLDVINEVQSQMTSSEIQDLHSYAKKSKLPKAKKSQLSKKNKDALSAAADNFSTSAEDIRIPETERTHPVPEPPTPLSLNITPLTPCPSLINVTNVLPFSKAKESTLYTTPVGTSAQSIPQILKIITVKAVPQTIQTPLPTDSTATISTIVGGQKRKIVTMVARSDTSDADSETEMFYREMELLDLDLDVFENQNGSDYLPVEYEQTQPAEEFEPKIVSVSSQGFTVKRIRNNEDGVQTIPEKNKKVETFPRCEFCKINFLDESRLAIHLKTTHSTEPLKYHCFLCKESFFSRVLLKRHETTHEKHYLDQDTCDHCPTEEQQSFNNRSALVTHILRVHELKLSEDEKSLECPKCRKRFMSNFLLYRHFTRHKKLDSKLPLVCTFCDARYPLGAEKNLKYHEKREHYNNWWCRLCTKRFLKEPRLRGHERMCHPELLVHQCDQCVKKYTKEKFLKTHVLAAHSTRISSKGDKKQKRFRCFSCELSYPVGEELARHLEVHTGESRESKWNSVARRKGDLSKLTPPSALPYQCPLCGMRFRKEMYLGNHQELCDPEAPPDAQMCQTCGVAFEGKGWSTLKKKHEEEVHGIIRRRKDAHKTCLCYQCGKTYRGGSLKQHLERSCNLKKKRVGMETVVDDSKVVQSTVCYFCGVNCNSWKCLKKHLHSQHTKECTFKCKKCGKRFWKKAGVMRHVWYVHRVQQQQKGKQGKGKGGSLSGVMGDLRVRLIRCDEGKKGFIMKDGSESIVD